MTLRKVLFSRFGEIENRIKKAETWLSDNDGDIQADSFNDNDFSNWAENNNLTHDGQEGIYSGSAVAESSSAQTSRLALSNYGFLGRYHELVYMKLDQKAGMTNPLWILWTQDVGGTAIKAGFGFNPSVSTTTWSYYMGGWKDAGFVLNTDWNKIQVVSIPTGNLSLYVNGSLLDTGTPSRLRAFIVRTSDNHDTMHIDRFVHSRMEIN